MPVSTEPKGRNSVKSLGERLAHALRFALGLGMQGGMPAKQLARDLGVDVKTVYGWMAGQGIRGEHLDALIQRMPQHFADALFANTGARVVKLADKRAALERAQQEYEEAVAIAGGGQ